jgi:hypothetical protein
MLFEIFSRRKPKPAPPRTLAEAMRVALAKRPVQGPPGMPEFMVRMKIERTAISHEVVKAFAAGVRPSYADWLVMPEDEREAWELCAAEHEKAQLAIQALVNGNTFVAKRALHDGDIEAIRNDAIMAGLEACGLI